MAYRNHQHQQLAIPDLTQNPVIADQPIRMNQPTTSHAFCAHFPFFVISLLVLVGWNSDLKAAPTVVGYDLSGNTASQQSATPAAPTITGQPASLFAASPRFSAGFSVNVASSSPVTYQWFFKGNPIPGATGGFVESPLTTLFHSHPTSRCVPYGGNA